MELLKHTFIVLQFVGMWRPVHWPPGWKKELYDTYTCLMMFLVVTVTLSEFVEFVNSIDDMNAFANNAFMLLTMMGVCGKATNILKKRGEIIDLTNVLQRDPYRPKSEEEFAIQRKFDEMLRSNLLRYGTLVGLTIIALILRSFLDDIPRRALPYNSWLPFDCNVSLSRYSIAYSHQIFTLIAGGTVHVAFDTLVTGLMLQTCAQLHILKHRFHEMPMLLLDKSNFGIKNLESTLLSQRVRHHIEIFKFAKTTNNLFGSMIFVQCTVSTIVICVSVFELSKMEIFSAEFTSCLLYLACMLVQIFMVCFYGYEGTFESTNVGDAIYEIEWTSLSIKTKRSLLTIMLRTLRPIEFTSFYIITLNLDSFNSLLKLSYSAYNVLQQKG